jgi:hypothetical protein
MTDPDLYAACPDCVVGEPHVCPKLWRLSVSLAWSDYKAIRDASIILAHGGTLTPAEERRLAQVKP